MAFILEKGVSRIRAVIFGELGSCWWWAFEKGVGWEVEGGEDGDLAAAATAAAAVLAATPAPRDWPQRIMRIGRLWFC